MLSVVQEETAGDRTCYNRGNEEAPQMAAKHRHPQPDKGQLAERVARARAEGRTMQALDLARQLNKADPSPAHQKLVFEVSLERARQLRNSGNSRDGATVAENAANLAQGPEQLGQ